MRDTICGRRIGSNHAASRIRAARSHRAATGLDGEFLRTGCCELASPVFVDAHRCEYAAPLVDKPNMASTSTSSTSSAPDDALPDPRRLFPPVATAGLETLPSTHDVSGLEPAPPPPSTPLQSPKKKKRPLSLLFCSCT